MSRLKRMIRFLRRLWVIWSWILKGKPLPPPTEVKWHNLEMARRRTGAEIFVETGTYEGETVQFARGRFNKVISVELSTDLHASAVRRFFGDESVELILGDSGRVMKELVIRPDLKNKPIVFWLDGHYSGGKTAKGDKDTPIAEELEAVLNRKNSRDAVLIDDARLFVGEDHYPSLEKLVAEIKVGYPGVDLMVRDDAVHIYNIG